MKVFTLSQSEDNKDEGKTLSSLFQGVDQALTESVMGVKVFVSRKLIISQYAFQH